ncbi:MAG: hypothetical protein K7J46_02415 [Bryobacter sp.]|jgi:hypothetical protein|nr:hypothetical protein [Bryobacter sp. CoA8 C33]MCE2937626.1 hypothetical protein [Flammeovirgaceae bacterium]
MAAHLRTLATLLIALGVGGGLFSLIWLLANGGPAGLSNAFENASVVLGPIVVGISILNILLAVPMVLTGLGLLRVQGWARSMGMVVCSLAIISIPLGSILGAYGLWVLTSLEVEPLFENRQER